MPAKLISSARAVRPTRLALLFTLATATPLADLRAQEVDDTALRYYVAHGEMQRAEAEAKRLAARHPGWVPSADVWTTRPNQANEAALWKLFAADDMAGLSRAIEARRIAEPGWRPSEDLSRKIRHKELRRSVLAQAADAQWSAVAALGAEFERTGDLSDLELSWIVAEGLARSGRQPEALSLYVAILNARSDAQERKAIIRKALAVLSGDSLATLLQGGRTDSSGRSEFADLEFEITRARIAAMLKDALRVPVNASELDRFEAIAEASADSADPALLGWLALKQGRTDDALTWFKLAISRGGDATIAHGLALSLLRAGMTREAEEVAFAWREPLINNLILYIDVFETELTLQAPAAIEPARLARYAKVTLDIRSGEGAQALGWYAYKSCEFAAALGWFQRASAWFPKETTILGQVLSLERLKRHREAVELANRYDGLFPQVVETLFEDPFDDNGPSCAPQGARPGTSTEARSRIPRATDAAIGLLPSAVKRTDFPIAVPAENPLRFPETRTKSSRERWRPVGPEVKVLVARRVGGVGAMPYERLGYTLLPGWNGATEPSTTPEANSGPARGTLAAAELAQAPARVIPRNLPLEDPATSLAAQRFKR